jgi:hypothetical protein
LSDTEFEIYVHNTLRARFPQNEGWQILEQPTAPSGARPDFLVNGPQAIIVVGANDKKQVERSDIDFLLDCATDLQARSTIIYTANDTEIPDSVAEYAKAKGVEVTRTQWWQDD